METQNNNLPASTNYQNSVAIISATSNILFETMSMSNNIVSFPFPGDQIKDWCKILKEERPDVTIEQLKLVFKKFRDGRTKWNHKESLPNIFRGIDLLKLEKGEHFCEEKQMKYRNYGSQECGNQRKIYKNKR